MAQPNSGEGDAPQAKRARLCEEALEKQTAEYKCPITRELMDDPVVAADGRLYGEVADVGLGGDARLGAAHPDVDLVPLDRRVALVPGVARGCLEAWMRS